MNIQKCLESMKNLQSNLLDFLEDDRDIENNFSFLNSFLEDFKIRDNSHELIPFLHLILKISNNLYRGPNFFSKIERILNLFKNDITKYFTNFGNF